MFRLNRLNRLFRLNRLNRLNTVQYRKYSTEEIQYRRNTVQKEIRTIKIISKVTYSRD